MLHGECVSVGMIIEAEAARYLNHCDSGTVQRLQSCLAAYGLPVRVPKQLQQLPQYLDRLMAKMANDKKNSAASAGNRSVNCVVLGGVGAVLGPPYTTAIPSCLLRRLLSRSIEVEQPVIFDRTKQYSIRVPGSKSLSNRVLVLAALCDHPVTVSGLLQSEDTDVMLNFLGKVGVRLEWAVPTQDLTVHGCGGRFTYPASNDPFYLGNAGTAARFLTSLCCLFPDASQYVELTGNDRMQERPIGDLVDCLRCLGARIEYGRREGCLPLRVYGGGLRGGNVTMVSAVSSQFTSSLLMVAPYCQSSLTLTLSESAPTSLPYIIMTTENMKEFGVSVATPESNVFHVPVGQYRVSRPVYTVEADASSATYASVLGAITGCRVTLLGVGSTSTQGDGMFGHVLGRMGCCVLQDEGSTTITGPVAVESLAGIDVNLGDMTDSFLALCIVAAVSTGVTRISGIANQRVKECDRIAAVVCELRKCGVTCREVVDGLEIEGSPLLHIQSHVAASGGVTIDCRNDHRIAMSFAVLACVVPRITVSDQRCVEKTYPEFWDDMHRVFGVNFRAADGNSDPARSSEGCDVTLANSSVVLVGMRGAGKSALGRAAAQMLGWQWLDVDREVERQAGCS
jgi:pentafunctional AROM polypeptide